MPCKLSDFLTRPQLHDLALYQDFFRIVGTEHQIVSTVRAVRTHAIGLTFNRECSDFTEGERLTLAVTRSALIEVAQAARVMARVRSALATMEMALTSLNAAVVRLHSDGRIRFASALARSWLTVYFPDHRAHSDQLPELLAQWVHRQSQQMSRRDGVPEVMMPIRVERETRALTVRMLLESGRPLLVLEERPTTVQPDCLQRLGLTPREAEVLFWVAQGKSNTDTATILGTRPRTVHKHLDRIFCKLGVENRTAAASRALSTLYE
jgi:DNA-binding CsgD family transcriptional regulator